MIDTRDPVKRYNISANGFADAAPKFSRDGRLVYWQRDFFGARLLDEKAAGQDVFATFLPQNHR